MTHTTLTDEEIAACREAFMALAKRCNWNADMSNFAIGGRDFTDRGVRERWSGFQDGWRLATIAASPAPTVGLTWEGDYLLYRGKGIGNVMFNRGQHHAYLSGGLIGSFPAEMPQDAFDALETAARSWLRLPVAEGSVGIPTYPVSPSEAEPVAANDLIERLLDAQQDVNIAANSYMDQSLCDVSALIDEIEPILRKALASPPASVMQPEGWQQITYRVSTYRDMRPEDGESWESWYFAAFDLLANDIKGIRTVDTTIPAPAARQHAPEANKFGFAPGLTTLRNGTPARIYASTDTFLDHIHAAYLTEEGKWSNHTFGDKGKWGPGDRENSPDLMPNAGSDLHSRGQAPDPKTTGDQ